MDTTLDDMIGMAARAHAEGRLDEAEAIAREALARDPFSAQARLLVGVVEAKTGRFTEAAQNLEEVVRQDRGSFHARMWLSKVYREKRRLPEAADLAGQAVGLHPNDPWALIQLGLCRLELREFEASLAAFKRAAQVAPGLAAAREGLGCALQALGKIPAAAQEFERAVALDPKSESAGLRLGEALLDQLDFAAAEACARLMVQRFPNSPPARVLLARALMDQGRGGEALDHARRAAELAPNRASIVAVHGLILQNLGSIQEAGDRFKEAVALDPSLGHAYFALAYNRKVTEEDAPLIRTMEELVENPATPAGQRTHLEYALGKAKQDLREFGPAMRHFDEANRLTYLSRFGTQRFDRKSYLLGVEFVEKVFTPRFMRAHSAAGIDSDLPIFVVGMMRSGTTLVEQILSSHSEIGAAGERFFWMRHRAEALKNQGKELDPAAVARLAREYIAELESVAPENRRVVDKMPVNYSILGLLHLALPHAKIVHVKRHAVDTCLSVYTTPNRSRIEWSNDKGNIVFAYRQYERLMRHWIDCLPEDRVLHIRYEDLILEREETTRKLIRFCGVEWEDSCLQPEKNERSVLTPSVWQVRQPVYRTSLERWRNYEPWLGEFAELLENEPTSPSPF